MALYIAADASFSTGTEFLITGGAMRCCDGGHVRRRRGAGLRRQVRHRTAARHVTCEQDDVLYFLPSSSMLFFEQRNTSQAAPQAAARLLA